MDGVLLFCPQSEKRAVYILKISGGLQKIRDRNKANGKTKWPVYTINFFALTNLRR